MQVCPRQSEVHVGRFRVRAGARDADGGPCVVQYVEVFHTKTAVGAPDASRTHLPAKWAISPG